MYLYSNVQKNPLSTVISFFLNIALSNKNNYQEVMEPCIGQIVVLIPVDQIKAAQDSHILAYN